MKFGIVVFPGSSGDGDCFHVIKEVLKEDVEYIWHQEKELRGKPDCLILPGGFSYGNYLRPGAIAGFSPIMEKVSEFAKKGGLVLGISNGFQVLTEAGLLPGAFLRNRNLKFISKEVLLRVENAQTPFTCNYQEGQIIKMPIAHGEGSYFCDQDTLTKLEENNQIVFRYSSATSEIEQSNFNGSLGNIAGIINEEGNVLGIMPHPERCAEIILGNDVGKKMFESMVNWLGGGAFNGKKSK